MKINRDALLSQMTSFFQENCVVTGDPGVGKSYLLAQVVKQQVDQRIPSAMISLDYLSDGSDEDINRLLGINGINWLDSLKRINIPPGRKGILIFDAFDTIRDEKLKKQILHQIATAQKDLEGYSIIVSVRTYDASKSPSLIKLFPQQYHHDQVHCRRFVIPELSEQELHDFLTGEDKLRAIYEGGTDKLHKVLKVPFFLTLLQTILSKTDTPENKIRAIKSEIELLEMYWTNVVYKTESKLLTEMLLMRLTDKMVGDRALSLDKFTALSELDSQQINITEHLLRENILAEERSGSRIAFAHNILFDYAISKYQLKSGTGELAKFINHDHTRPFFLRPSFTYFFAGLWYTDRKTFWRVLKELPTEQNEVMELFVKLIPCSVIAKEFESVSELEFLGKQDQQSNEHATNVLQAIRFQGITSNKKAQSSLLLELSSTITTSTISELVFLLEQLIKDPEIKADPTSFDHCGKAARNLLQYFLSLPEEPYTQQYAGRNVLHLVTRTFSTDPSASKKLIRPLLDKLDQPNFEISFFSSLSDELKHFYREDPELCAEIYEKIYSHRETSMEQQTMLPGAIMSFTSSRHDQFDLCHYILYKFFPTFLSEFPEAAIPMGLRITNAAIADSNEGRISKKPYNGLPLTFQVNGINASYNPDDTAYRSSQHNGTFKHSKAICEFLSKTLLDGNTKKFTHYLELYLSNAQNAFNWKCILDEFSKHPQQALPLMLPLLLQPAVLFCNDSRVSAGNFLAAISPYLQPKQIEEVEMAILSIDKYPTTLSKEYVLKQQQILLSQIPFDNLQTENSKELIKNLGQAENTDPFQFSHSTEEFTTEMYLAENGVDVGKEEVAKLMALENTLSTVNYRSQNDSLTTEEATAIFPVAVEAFQYLKEHEDVDLQVKEMLLRSIAGTCVRIMQAALRYKPEDFLESSYLKEIKEMLLTCWAHQSSTDSSYEQEQPSPAGGHSPTARSEAASVLVNLFYLTGDTELLRHITEGASNANPIVRHGIASSIGLLYRKQPEFFWQLMNERLKSEDDTFIVGCLVMGLNRKEIFDSDSNALVNAFQLATPLVADADHAISFLSEAYFNLSLIYFKDTGDPRIIEMWHDAIQKSPELRTVLVRESFEILKPANFYRNYSDPNDIKRSERIIKLLSDQLDLITPDLTAPPSPGPNPKIKHAFDFLHELILRIYFALQVNYGIGRADEIQISPEEKEQFYFFAKPIIEKILAISKKIGQGIMQGPTAHYLIEMMTETLAYDPKFALDTVVSATEMTQGSGYTYDHMAIDKTIAFTEKLLSDHKELLLGPEDFKKVMNLLNIYARIGRPEALQLLWKLDDVFR